MLNQATSVTAQPDVGLIQQLAALQGLRLTPEQAGALLPALAMILTADAQVAELGLDELPAVGLPWEIGLEGYA